MGASSLCKRATHRPQPPGGWMCSQRCALGVGEEMALISPQRRSRCSCVSSPPTAAGSCRGRVIASSTCAGSARLKSGRGPASLNPSGWWRACVDSVGCCAWRARGSGHLALNSSSLCSGGAVCRHRATGCRTHGSAGSSRPSESRVRADTNLQFRVPRGPACARAQRGQREYLVVSGTGPLRLLVVHT